MTVFQAKNGHFSMFLPFFFLLALCCVEHDFFKFFSQFYGKNIQISGVLLASRQLVKNCSKRLKYTFIFKN